MAMEKGSVTYQNSGDDIIYSCKNHESNTCQEFTITSPPFRLKRWLLWTSILNMIGYFMQFHLQDIRIISVIGAVVVVLLILKLIFKVKQESLLIIKSVGVQVSTVYASGRRITHFYDIRHVKDIIINEGITMHKVVFYLCILLQDHPSSGKMTKLIPLYQNTMPPLQCLCQIYRTAQKLLQAS